MKGELGLPYTGVATFLGAPMGRPEDLRQGSVGVLGVPWDSGVGFRPGARAAPRALRHASMRYRIGQKGFFDVEEERYRLRDVRLLDLGDVDILYLDVEETFSRVTEAVQAIAIRKAIPVVLGGDHSITFPAVRGLLEAGAVSELFIVQFDAHLDFRHEVHGVRLANSSPIRRISELEGVRGGVNFGVRGWRTSEDDYRQAIARGFQPVLAKAIHRQDREGRLEELLDLVPPHIPVYVTLDIDGIDPALAPGTGSPEPEGLTYTQVKTLLRALGRQNPIAGIDLVEVNPYFDPTERTLLVGVALLLEALTAALDRF